MTSSLGFQLGQNGCEKASGIDYQTQLYASSNVHIISDR